MIQEFTGAVRIKVTPIAEGVQLHIFDEATNETIWLEGITPPQGCSAVSQIRFEGTAKPVAGYVIDPEGKRHFVLNAQTSNQ